MSELYPKQTENSVKALKSASPELNSQAKKSVEQEPTDGLLDDDWHPDFSI